MENSRTTRRKAMSFGLVIALGLVAHASHGGDRHALRAHLAANVERDEARDEEASDPKGLSWALHLQTVVVRNAHTQESISLRPYLPSGELDSKVVVAFSRLFGWADTTSLDTRAIQLALRAAYHFGGATIVAISGFRPRQGKRENPHSEGRAIDFRLESVKPRALAEHLRTYARAGVGLYVHPRTQYVHLDVRNVSFHWVDGSPPGITWKEQAVRDPKQVARDAEYSVDQDLPEAAVGGTR